MSNTITVTGTGGIIEGNLGPANVNVNLDRSLMFDGTNDFIQCGTDTDHDFTDHFTLACWAKNDNATTTGGDREHLIAKYAGSNGHRIFRLYLHGSTLRFGVGYNSGNNSVEITHSMTGLAEHWNHYAASFDGGVMKLYVNGVLVTNTDNSGTLTAIHANNSRSLNLGGYEDGDHTWTGQIADVRIYNAVVDQPDIQLLASKINTDSSLGVGTTNLKGYWKLNNETASGGGSGTGFVVDESGTVNQGTLTNFSGTYWDYDAYSVDVYDNSTTTDGTFTITQGKVEGKALSKINFDGTNDILHTASDFTMSHDGSTISVWVNKDNATGNEDTIMGETDDANQHWWKIDANGDIEFRDYGTGSVRCDVAIVDTNWHHVVVTLNGDNNGAIYVDGVAQTLTANAVTADLTFDSFGARGSTTDPFDGQMQDIRVYDYALSADQVASLYSGTYPQTPLHHWRLDEGSYTGNYDRLDTGTATAKPLNASGATMQNGTLDLDHDLVIAANGTLSAPRGDLSLVRNFQNSGTYTHNNGTFAAVGGDNTFINTTGTVDPVFYNVRLYALQLRFYQDTTIERQLQLDSSATHCYIWANKTLTMGTATNPETDYPKLKNNMNTGDKQFFFYAGDGETATLQGVLETHPIIFTNTNSSDIEWGYHANSTAQIKNIDFQFDLTTDGDTDNIKLTGDCEFDTVTISSGATLDLNGQRAEFSGNLSNQSTGSGNGIDYDGMIYFTGSGRMDSDGASTNLDLLTLVQQGTSTSDADLAGDNLIKTMFYNQPSVTQKNHRGAIQTIIGTGTSTCGSGESPDYTNLKVATGGTLDGSSSTLTVAGDFTTTGGLIGKSALDFDGTSTCRVADHSDFDSLTNATWMGWYKIDDVSADRNFMGQSSSFSLQVIENSTNKPRFSLYDSGGSGWTDLEGNTTITVDNKWHHIAFVMDGSNNKMYTYIDGKLDSEGAWTGTLNGSSADIFIGGYRDGNVKGFAGFLGNASFWNVALTSTQIRAKMFSDFAGLDSNTGCKGWWQFDEGTGGNGDTTASSVGSHPATLGPAGNAPNWAGAGTFTYGTSTLNFTKSGTAVFNYLNDEDIYNLTIGTGNTLRLECLDDSGGRVDIFGTLNMTGTKITTGVTSGNSTISFSGTGDRTNVINNPSTALADLYRVSMLQSSDTITMPAVTLKRLICNGAGTTLLSGALTVNTGDLQVQAGTLNTSSSDHAITCAGDCKVTGTLTLNGSAVTVGALEAISGAAITQDSDGTIEITAGSNFGTASSYSFKNADGTSDVNLGGTLTISGGTYFDPRTAPTYASVLNNVVGNAAAYWVGKVTIGGNYTLNAGDKWQTYGGSDSFIVNGSVLLNGHLSATSGFLAAGSTGEMKFGGLKLPSGGTYTATPLTTTITNRYTGESHLWKNDGGTYTHNNGTVKFNDNDHSAVKENTFYNVEVESNLGDYAVSFEAQGGGGNPFTILGDLTITRGDFELANANDTCDINGKTIINGSSNSAARFNNDKNQTATITHHGPVEILTGTYHVEDGGSVKILGGFRNMGGLVD